MAEIAGILHCFLTYVDVEEDTYDYVHKCADYVGQHVLSQLTSLSDNEKEMISDGEFFYAPTDPAGPEGDCLKKRYHPKATYRNGGGKRVQKGKSARLYP